MGLLQSTQTTSNPSNPSYQSQSPDIRQIELLKTIEAHAYDSLITEEEKRLARLIVRSNIITYVWHPSSLNISDQVFITNIQKLVSGYITCIRNEKVVRSKNDLSHHIKVSLEKQTMKYVADLEVTYEKAVGLPCVGLTMLFCDENSKHLQKSGFIIELLTEKLSDLIYNSNIVYTNKQVLNEHIHDRVLYYLHVDLPEEKFLLESFFVIRNELLESGEDMNWYIDAYS